MYFNKYIDNIKRFFKDDTGDYKPIGCVAATLNNSVLYKTHISCDETVNYFVCKQSEYLLWLCSLCFTKCVRFTIFAIFYGNSFEIVNFKMLLNTTRR